MPMIFVRWNVKVVNFGQVDFGLLPLIQNLVVGWWEVWNVVEDGIWMGCYQLTVIKSIHCK